MSNEHIEKIDSLFKEARELLPNPSTADIALFMALSVLKDEIVKVRNQVRKLQQVGD